MNEHEARQVACDWHSGQWSPLYAFCSSGTITDPDAVVTEIDDAIAATVIPEDIDDLAALTGLIDYVWSQFPEPDDAP